jgi:TetR/AcrR family transcriptional regulator, transcriptional repressor for nem operon
LPTDVRRSSGAVKAAFEEVFGAMVGTLEQSMRRGNPARQTKAQAIAALCIGGLVVARAMHNGPGAEKLRKACMAVALELGDWEKIRRAKRANFKSA